jgi:hypothetical protein
VSGLGVGEEGRDVSGLGVGVEGQDVSGLGGGSGGTIRGVVDQEWEWTDKMCIGQ